MAYAEINKNSKLGAALNKRKEKAENENTAVIDRNSGMGQYLASTAESTVGSILQSIQNNASAYASTQRRFASFAENNSRYVSDSDAGQKFSDNFAKQYSNLDKQQKQLRRLGYGTGNVLYDTVSQQRDWFRDNGKWLSDRLKYSSQFKDAKAENKSYYGWLNDDADTNAEITQKRREIYDENVARIAEIDSEMEKYGRHFSTGSGIPVYLGWGDKEKYKELKAEKEALEAENRQYDRTQGKTDKNYAVTQNADFAQNASAGENKNPTYSALSAWGAELTAAARNRNENEIAEIWDRQPLINDKLALYDDAATNTEFQDLFGKGYFSNTEHANTYSNNYEIGSKNRWDLLTGEERKIYYYLRNTQGKDAGDDFLDSMATVLGKRAVNESAKKINDMSGTELVLNNIASVPLTVMGNIGAFTDTVVQMITGQEYNPYSVGNRVQAYAGLVRGETAGRIDNKTNNFSVLGTSMGDVYQALMSGVDSAVGVFALGSPLHLAQAGMGALTSTARELYDRGASESQILGVSVAAGVFEMLFEKVSIDKFTESIIGKPTKTVADIIKKTLIQGGTEASEEFCTELANMLTEAVILGDRQRVNDDISQYMQDGDSEAAATAKAWMMNLYDAAMGGFISGAAMGGVSATAQYANHQLGEVPATGRMIIENGGVEDLANTANELSGTSSDNVKPARSERVLRDAAADALEIRSARNVGKLYDRVEQYESKVAKTARKLSANEYVKDAGLKGIEKLAVKKALMSEGEPGKLSRAIVKNSEVFDKAEKTRAERAEHEEAERKAKIEKVDTDIKASDEEIHTAVKNGNTANLVQNRLEGVRNDGLDVSLGAITKAENGQISVEYDRDTHASAIFDADGTVEIKGADGETVQTVKSQNAETNTLYDELTKAVSGNIEADNGVTSTGQTVKTGTTMSVNAANLALSLYNETANPDSGTYVRMMYETYKAGRNGLPFETLRQSLTGKYNVTAYDGTATEGQLRQMYKAGISEMSARKGVTRIGVKSVTDGDHRHALTQLSVLDEFARKHRLSIVCVDTLYDETGAEINGEYRTGNNIVISLDADGGLYMPVVGHEVFHYAESIDTEQAGILTQMVINTLEQTKGAEWLADRRAEYGKQYDKSEVDSEIAADFFGAAITQKEFGNYIRSAKMNKSFTKKIVNKIKQIVADLRGIMQKLRGQRLIYDATLDLDAETLDFFTDSIETILSQAGTEQAETAKATKNTADEGGASGSKTKKTSYSVKFTTDNKPVAVIDEDILDGVPKKKWVETVKQTLTDKFSNGIPISGRLIKVNKISRSEFTNSKYSKFLKAVDGSIYQDKLRSSNNLDDIVLASTNYINEALKHSRNDNFKEFARGEVLLRVNKNDYKANVIVGLTQGNQMVLYDVIDFVPLSLKIKERTSKSAMLNAGSERNKMSFDNKVTQESPSVNTNLSENAKKIPAKSKKQAKISAGMSEAERAEVLRNTEMTVAEYKGNSEDLNAANVLGLQNTYKSNAAPILKTLAKKFGIFDKSYSNDSISLDFNYSRGSLRESVHKQGRISTDFYDFAKMLYVFDDVVENAVPIEVHTDKYVGTKRESPNLKNDYVLISAFSDGDYIIPVEMNIKEFSNQDQNKLYVSVTLGKIKEDGIKATPQKQNVSTNITNPSSKINVAQLISKVNPEFSNFYKYVPSELLSDAQNSSKTVAVKDENYRLKVMRGEDVSAELERKAEKAGYSRDESWKMDHRAPNADDDTSHNMAEIDKVYGGDGSIYSQQAVYYYGEGRSYDKSAVRVIQSARNNPDKMISVYRAVPLDLKETRLRNGDWVAIVKQYAEEHGERVLDGNYRIIEMKVPAKHLYGNGDSINEWGYDNGNRKEVYKNTSNNVKTLEVTFDDGGEVIPLSKRYDENNPDIRFQRKLPDVQQRLNDMSRSDSVSEAVEGAKALADELMDIVKSERLNMTETDGLMPQSTKVADIVRKYNDVRKTGVSNTQMTKDITDIFSDYMHGVGSSDTLINYISDNIMKRELKSFEVYGTEAFDAVKALTEHGKFSVTPETAASLIDNWGSLGEVNRILRENYGFTVASAADERAANRSPWAPTGQEIATEIPYAFDGTDYTDNAKDGFEYETIAALVQSAERNPVIYRGWLTEAKTAEERIIAQDELADYVSEEALRMYGELMSAPALKTKADRYRDALSKYADKHFEQLNKYKERLKESRLREKEIAAEYRVKMKDLRDTKNEKINAVRQAYIERIDRQRASRNETAVKVRKRAAIAKKAKTLTNLFVNESDQKHIPQELKKTVSEFLLPFTENSSVFGKDTQDGKLAEKFMRMHDLLTDIYNATEGDSADSATLNGYYREFTKSVDADLIDELNEIRKTVSGKRLSELSVSELETVDKIISNVSQMVKSVNELRVNNRKTTLSEIGERQLKDLEGRKKRKIHKRTTDLAIDFLNDMNTTGVYFFNEKLGGEFANLNNDIRDAQDKWYKRCDEIRLKISDLQKKYDCEPQSKKNAEKSARTFKLSDGETVTLTTEQIMSIYATAKRERLGGNNTTHVFDGGIVVEEAVRKNIKSISDAVRNDNSGDKLHKKISRAAAKYLRSEAKHLTVEELAEITATLTDNQKAYIDGVVGLLSTDVAAWGNETSEELYGYKKFTEKYYFPIATDKSYLYTRFGVSEDTRLKHSGFTNKVKRGAHTPVVITDFTSTAASHINQMALYSSFAVPIENMTRVYNYERKATVDANGHAVRGMSVKKALTNAYGTAANNYIADYLKAINGGIKADRLESAVDWGTSKFKRAAVMANLSVIVQQPSAIARATAIIDPKYLFGFKKLDGNGLAEAANEMYKYSAVAGIKKLGGFDVGTGATVTDWIANGNQTLNERISDFLGKGAEKADEVTWTNIWLACKREINARIRAGELNVEIGSEEYFNEVAKRFRDIADYTQVYDSVLTKSQLMRSKSGFVKMITAFMAEPTLSYNLVINSRKGNMINAGRAFAAFAANVILNTLLQSFVAALRDKDDLSYWERYIKSVTGSLAGTKDTGFVLTSEFNPFANLPIVRDLVSAVQGFEIERTDISPYSDVIEIFGKLVKTATDRESLSEQESKKYEGMTKYEEQLHDNLVKTGIMISNFTPVPLQSVYREITGVVNMIKHAKQDGGHFRTTAYTAADAVKAGIGFEEEDSLKAYNAVKNNEDEVLRRMKSSDSWNKWVRNGLKEYDRGEDTDKKAINRIEQAATANYSGDYEKYEKLVSEIEKEGFDRNDILAAVEGLVGKMRPKETDAGEPSAKHLYTNKMLEDAIKQDNAQAVKDIKDKLKKVEGKTDEQVKNAVKNIAKDFYENGDESNATRILRTYGGFDADEVKEALAWWNYSDLNPDSDLPYMSWQSWRNKAASGTVNDGKGKITASQYEMYYNATKGLTGDDLDGDGKADSGTKKKKVVAAIDSLPLTSDQKDTLYLMNNYGRSTLGETPWH